MIMPVNRKSVLLTLAVLAVAALAGPGCGTSARVIRMDPLRIESQVTPEGVRVEVMDPEVLFIEGAQAFEARKHREAARKFGLIVERFPESRLMKAALYNRALALLAFPRPLDAARDFEEYLRLFPDDNDAADAWQKLGQAYSESGEWEKADAALKRRLELEPLILMQEVEIRARLTRGARMLGRYEETRNQVDKVKALHDRYRTLPEMDGNYYVAMASFEGAEAYCDLFGRIKFILPVERMEKDLIDKATLFLKAQSEYLATIRLRNTYWGVKAGVQVGRLYEEFFEDIMNAEVPPELAPDEMEIYLGELKKKTRPLVRKAVDAYERNMALARMYGAKDEWFGDTHERLGRLRKILDAMPKD